MKHLQKEIITYFIFYMNNLSILKMLLKQQLQIFTKKIEILLTYRRYMISSWNIEIK